jgi:predicted metal-dependent hydrolase
MHDAADTETQPGLWRRDETRLASEPRVSFSIRESRRARQLILQALPPRTIELVVPAGMRARTVDRFVREHAGWIARASAELVAMYPEPSFRPESIRLEALGEEIAVEYAARPGFEGRHRYDPGRLTLYCRRADAADAPQLLQRWLVGQGRRLLKPWLAREAERTGLEPSRVQVRLQRTRWGSCSARGNVSLNAALLLVPPELVRYLCVHELCHLEHLSHSRRYWASVARHEPGFRDLDRRLARSWRGLPAWVLAGEAGEIA